jgi:indolepyruvate decarboxylase
MVAVAGHPQYRPREWPQISDPRSLKAALADAAEMINAARQPVIVADVELHRFALQERLLRLARKTNIPVASTLLGKSVIGEQHPFYLGVYEGAMGREDVRRYVESSDCVILLGVFLTDINLGVFTARLDPARSIYATSEKLSVRYHVYEDARFQDFLQGLARAKLRKRKPGRWPHPPRLRPAANVRPDAPVTVRGLFERLNVFLRDDTVVVCDVGESLFGAADLYIHRGTEFLGPAYYASMGFAVPAGIGVQLANPRARPLVLVGDGAFQMTGMEISGALRYGLNPIVVVLNNHGYGTERPMQDGPYNDLQPWRYHRLPEVLGGGRGFLVRTVKELNDALEAAARHTGSFCVIEVLLDKYDHSPALQRLTQRLARKI